MKTIPFFLSILSLALILFISSCSKDEEGIPNNVIRYDGKNYKLAFAFGIT